MTRALAITAQTNPRGKRSIGKAGASSGRTAILADARNKEEVRELMARAELIRSNLESQAELCRQVAEVTSHADGLAAEWNEIGAEMSSLLQKLFPARLGSNAIDASTKTSGTALPSNGFASTGADGAEEKSAVPRSPKTPFARRTGSFVDLVAQGSKLRAA